MENTGAASNEIGFWHLVFSAPGATIAICITVIVVAAIIYRLSRRFPQISLQYGNSKLELKREPIPIENEFLEAGVASNPSITAGLDKEAARAISSADASDDSGLRYFDLQKAIEAQDRQRIEEIFDSFKSKPISYAPYGLEVWRNVELLRAGFADARMELERIERENPKESDASEALTRYYLGIRAIDQARRHIDILISRAESDEKLATAILLKANYIESVDDRNMAIKFLLSEVGKMSQPEGQSKVYEALGDRYRDQKRDGLAIGAYERALSCDVHNKQARFQLAYVYSQNDTLQSLSLRHYRILLRQDPRYLFAENNLGIVYGKLGLNVPKIEAWQSAAGHNDGYSIGNLMFAYLEAGFIEMAEKVFDEAASYAKSNPRVVAAYTRLKGARESDDQKLDQIRENAEALWRELNKGNISFESPKSDWIGEWKDTDGVANLKVARSGEFIEVEMFEGVATWKGFAKAAEGLTVVAISQESHTASGLLSVLYAQRGQLLMLPTELGLKVIHLLDDKVHSARIYTRISQA